MSSQDCTFVIPKEPSKTYVDIDTQRLDSVQWTRILLEGYDYDYVYWGIKKWI